MAKHCDIRFAAGDAHLGQPEINIGFIPPVVGTTQALARLIGRPRALEYLFDGKLLSAEEALAIGRIDIIRSPESLHKEVQAYAQLLARKPAKALSAIRLTIVKGDGMTFNDSLKLECEPSVKLADTGEFSEGLRDFLEKREPQWE